MPPPEKPWFGASRAFPRGVVGKLQLNLLGAVLPHQEPVCQPRLRLMQFVARFELARGHALLLNVFQNPCPKLLGIQKGPP